MKKLIIIMAGLSLAGCATVTRGTTDDVQILSNPTGLEARTSLGHSCKTPCTIQVSRKSEFQVVYTGPDGEEKVIPVMTDVGAGGAAGVAGNAILGGLIGAGVDVATGASLDHHPNPVYWDAETDSTQVPEELVPKKKQLPPNSPGV